MVKALLVTAPGKNGQVIFDGRNVKITREGFRGRVGHGRGVKVIPLSQVSGVQLVPWTWTKGWGYLSLTVPGSLESHRSHGKGVKDAFKDENSVVFSRAQEDQFRVLHDAILAMI